MAVVGDAYIVVRAITNQVRDDIRNGLKDIDKDFERTGNNANNAFNRGFGGGGKSPLSKLGQEAAAAREKFNQMIQMGYFAGPAIAGLLQTILMLGAGIFALGAQIGAAAPSLVALGNAATAGAQAMVVFKMAVSGVGAALSAGMKAQKASGAAAADNSKQIEAATDRVRSAIKRLAQTVQENSRREEAAAEAVDSAKKREIDAYKRTNEVVEENAERIEDALERIEAAKEREADALKNVQKAREAEEESSNAIVEAQEGVTKAIEDSIEAFQQLRFRLEEAVLSEQRAVLGFQDAREALAKVSNLPPNNRQRKEAELAFAEADLRLRQAKDRTSDTAKEVDKENKKGVEGSDRVVAARKRVTDAEKSYQLAQERTSDAIKRATEATKQREKAEQNLSKVQKENSERLADAIEAQNEATKQREKSIRDYNATLAENVAREAEAREAVKEAKEALEEAKKGTNAASSANKAFQDALNELSPSARAFVLDLIDLRSKFSDLKSIVQENFFKEINKEFTKTAENILPVLEKRLGETGKILGNVGKSVLQTLGSPENVQILDRLFGSNNKIIDDFGAALNNLLSILLNLFDAARPVAERFSNWVKTLTEGWKASTELGNKTGKLGKTLSYAGDVAATLGDIFGDLFGSIMDLGKAASGPGSGGEELLNALKKGTQAMRDFTSDDGNRERFVNFFRNAAEVFKVVAGTIGDLFKHLGKSLEDGVTPKGIGEDSDLMKFFTSIREAVNSLGPTLNTFQGTLPIIGETIASIASSLANLASSGALETFFTVLKEFFGFISSIVSSPVFLAIFATVAPVFALSRGFALVYKFSKFLLQGTLIGPIMALKQGIGDVKAKMNGVSGESDKMKKGIKDATDCNNTTNLNNKLQKTPGYMGLISVAARIMGMSMTMAMGPVGLIILGVVAAVAALALLFKGMYDNSETLRTSLDTLRKNVLEKLKEAWEKILAPLKELRTALEKMGMSFGWLDSIMALISGPNGFNEVLGKMGDFVGKYIVPIFQIVLFAAIDYVVGVITILIKIIVKVITTLMDVWNALSTFGKSVETFFRELPEKIREKVEAFKEMIRNIWDSWVRKFNNVVDAIKNYFLVTLPEWWNGVKSDLKDKFEAVWQPLKDKFCEIWNNIKRFFTETIPNTVSRFVDTLKAYNPWDFLLNGLKTIANKIVDFWNRKVARDIGFSVPDAFRAALSSFGLPVDYSITIPKLDPIALAEGGIVRATPGGVMARIAEAGQDERVEPLDPDGLSKRDKAILSYLSGGSGTVINVYPSPGMNERELAEKVSKELAFMMRRGGF